MAWLNWLVFFLTLISAGSILVNRNWRWNLVSLAIQYGCVFWLVQVSWDVSLALVKLITGWMICVILGLAHLHRPPEEPVESSWPQGGLFRLMVISLVLVVAFLGAQGMQPWLGIEFPAAWGGSLLIGLGLLLAGITIQPFRVILGLLTFLMGFEVIYAAMESSSLVTGLLVLVNLGLAVAGAYFLSNEPGSEQA